MSIFLGLLSPEALCKYVMKDRGQASTLEGCSSLIYVTLLAGVEV